MAYSLADIIALNAIESATYEEGPRDYLTTFFRLVMILRDGETKFVTLLQAKIREVLPSLAMYLNIPHAPPQTPSSTQSGGSSSNALVPPMHRIDSAESGMSSPYSPIAMAGPSSAPIRYPAGAHVTSLSPSGESGVAGGISMPPHIASSATSSSESGLTENISSRGGNPFPHATSFPGSGQGFQR